MLYQLSYASQLESQRPKSMASRNFPPHGTKYKSYHNGIPRATRTPDRHFRATRPDSARNQNPYYSRLKPPDFQIGLGSTEEGSTAK
jgi:hypothetical protein